MIPLVSLVLTLNFSSLRMYKPSICSTKLCQERLPGLGLCIVESGDEFTAFTSDVCTVERSDVDIHGPQESFIVSEILHILFLYHLYDARP